MVSDTYNTIAANSEGQFKDKGSRFIALAYPVYSEDEIKNILTKIKKQYYDATHHCYAFRLGLENEIWRANDDGEPSGSAGRPILGQLQSKELTNILVIVIRYYGGVKLGVSGLINAYRNAANEALLAAKIIEKTIDIIFEINFDYISMNSVMKIIKDENIKQISHDFGLHCSIKLLIRKRDYEHVISLFQKIESVEIIQE